MIRTQLSHVAFLVPSVHFAAEVVSRQGLSAGPAESFEGEGTLEVYVGPSSHNGLLLLMEAEKDGAYKRALQKRGPGLHHIAIDVMNLEAYVDGLAGSGWLLHPRSLHTIKKHKTAYLARPGFPALIEVHERPHLSEQPLFITEFQLNLKPENERLLKALGLPELKLTTDAKDWLTCQGKKFQPQTLWP